MSAHHLPSTCHLLSRFTSSYSQILPPNLISIHHPPSNCHLLSIISSSYSLFCLLRPSAFTLTTLASFLPPVITAYYPPPLLLTLRPPFIRYHHKSLVRVSGFLTRRQSPFHPDRLLQQTKQRETKASCATTVFCCLLCL